jgi:integrase
MLPKKLYSVPGKQYLRRDTPEATRETRYYSDFKDARGKRRRLFLGRSLKVAEHKLWALLAEVSEQTGGPLPAAGPYRLEEAQRGSMAELVKRGIARSTRRRYASCDRNALERFGKSYLDGITKTAVKEWFADRAAEKSTTTANRDLQRLAQVLDWAVEQGWIDTNPARKVKKFREHGRSSPLTPGEEGRLKSACSAELWGMVRFALITGIRQGEQLSLTWAHVHGDALRLQGRESKRRRGETKTHRGRWVPLLPEAVEILNAQRERVTGDLIWPNTAGNRWQRNNFRLYRWRPAFDVAGLQDMTWHDLRHTFCSRLRQGGADLVDIADLAGHSNLSVTRRYAHHSQEHLRKIIQLLGKKKHPRKGGE